MGSASRVEPPHLIPGDPLLVDDQRQLVDLGLCHEHPVERIGVVLRKLGGGDRMLDPDRQFAEVAVLDP